MGERDQDQAPEEIKEGDVGAEESLQDGMVDETEGLEETQG